MEYEMLDRDTICTGIGLSYVGRRSSRTGYVWKSSIVIENSSRLSRANSFTR
jgi:hypothetical protein